MRGATAPGSDGPSVLIGLITRALPARRRDWGTAMVAELGSVDGRADRRRFATSCLRVVVRDRVTLAGVTVFLAVAGTLAAAIVATTGILYAPVRIEGMLLVAGLVLIAAGGRRDGGLGPVGPSRAARYLRGAAQLATSAVALSMIAGLRPPHTDGLAVKVGATAVFVGVVLAVALGVQAVTAQRSSTSPTSLGFGAGTGLLAGASWYVFVILGSPGYHDHHRLAAAALTVASLAATTAIAASASRGGPTQGMRAGVLAFIVASVLIFAAPVATYTLLPQTAPDPSPGSFAPQLSQGAHDDQDAADADEPYIVGYLLSGMLALIVTISGIGERDARLSQPTRIGQPESTRSTDRA